MPTYEYRCNKCGEQFELFQTFADEPLKKHPGCGGKVVKVMSAAGIVFSGSGFYKTDNRDSSRSKAAAKAADSSGSTESKDAKSSKEAKSSDSSSSESSSTAKSDSASKTPPKTPSSGEKKSA
jgi:putative FmdB family regulatory protein